MSLSNTAYDTTLGSIIDTKVVSAKIVESFIQDELYKENIGVDNGLKVKPVYVTGYYESENNIPMFTHPVLVQYKGTDYLCTDLRLYINTKGYKDTKNIIDNIRNRTEYNFMRSMSIMTLAWLNGSTGYIKDNLKFAGVVFSVNVSEAITRAYSLDPNDRLRLNVLSYLYYRSLFLSAKENIDENFLVTEYEIAEVQCMKAFGISNRFFRDTIYNIPKLLTVNDYIEAIKVSLDNTRLTNFNIVVLLTLIKNSWYGNNAKDYITVSLEYPPTWLAIVYTALNEKTYKSSMIYKIIERLKKGSDIDTYNSAFEDLVTRFKVGVSLEEQLLDLELDAMKFSDV